MAQTTSASAPAPHTKQYVFVDEYNRHKRLKVMRACDGCRKRKIRCDGALQNGPWPCGACLRLKLKCVPPTLDPDDEFHDSATSQTQFTFQNTTVEPVHSSSMANGIMDSPHVIPDWSGTISMTAAALPSTLLPPNIGPGVYPSQHFHQHLHRDSGSYSNDDSFSINPARFRPPPPPSLGRSLTSGSSGDTQDMEAAVRELSEYMGAFSIDITSSAPYIANENRLLAETPAIEEADVVLPLSVSTDSTVKIPPEMMPTDDRAIDYFGYFFDYIHPYSPVLNRAAFYEQWRSARHSISPLVLEGIFACVARYLERPVELRRWVALASRHEESFKDVPRLSTIQAMILITRAREALPRRGYYYRSWMAVKYMSTMAFDLGLHEHADQHASGKPCKFSKPDCLVRTRVWQTIFSLEILVGAPQGRTDFAVELETVEVEVPMPSAEVDAYEHAISRRFTFMMQAFRNVKLTNMVWQRLRRVRKDWALDPTFTVRNDVLPTWLNQLPPDFQMQYPDDDSAPFLGNDHFVAYVHVYHHLVVVMHHRPQLHTLLEKGDQGFRKELDTCLDSAVMMCRVQEALLRDFGMHGLQFMLRGINFTIYCVLTCTMLHLAAITSPDQMQNTRARGYFARHMRVLESCIPGAGPDMVVQINALREAFSQDTSRAFELKPTLGLRSPSVDNASTPSDFRGSPSNMSVPATQSWSSQLHSNRPSRTGSPTSDYSTPYDRGASQSMTSQPSIAFTPPNYQLPATTPYSDSSLHRVTPTSQTGYALEPVSSNEQLPAWDPSGIFNHWNTAFGAATPLPPPPRGMLGIPTVSASTLPPLLSPGSQHNGYDAHPPLPTAEILGSAGIHVMPAVTPIMWQDAFTNAFVSGHGQKRYREASVDHTQYSTYTSSKRRA